MRFWHNFEKRPRGGVFQPSYRKNVVPFDSTHPAHLGTEETSSEKIENCVVLDYSENSPHAVTILFLRIIRALSVTSKRARVKTITAVCSDGDI